MTKNTFSEFELLSSTMETKDFMTGLKLIIKEAAKFDGREAAIFGREQAIICGNFAHTVDEDFLAQLESYDWHICDADETAFQYITG